MMPEVCFYSPSEDRFWVAINEPSEELLAQYPDDSIEVPLPPEHSGTPSYADGVFTWIPNSPVEQPYFVSKFTIWLRLTDTEAETVTSAMTTQPARLRGLWEAASNVWSNSEFFGTLKAFVTGVLGEARAAEILAPEDAPAGG